MTTDVQIICKHCAKPIRDTSGVDPNVPWVHEVSGNAYCGIDCPEEAVFFAGTPGRSEAQPERTLELLAQEIIAELDESYDLINISQGDHLTTEQISALVRGDTDTFMELLDEFESEALWHGAKHVIDEAVKATIQEWEDADSTEDDDADHSELADSFDGSEQFDEVRFAIEERESGDWVRALVSASGTVLLRIPIDALDEDHAYSYQEVDSDECLTRIGIPVTDENRRTVQYTLDNASPEFSTLMGYWIVGAAVEAFWNMPNGLDDLEVDIVNPHLYLGNPFMGDGFISEEPLIGTVRVRRDQLRTDNDAFGYPVDKIYDGLSPSSFEAELRWVAQPVEATSRYPDTKFPRRIDEILAARQHGQDCNRAESPLIERIVTVNAKSAEGCIAQIQVLFPAQYAEGLAGREE